MALVLAAATAGCGSSHGTPASVELTVFGAASLRDVLARVEDDYGAAHPDIALTVSTDSSAALRVQIEQGAPADVFLSADTDNPQALADAGLAGAPVAFATNSLAIIVPLDNPANLQSPADLAALGVRVIAAGERVPITRYATQLIAKLATLDGHSGGFVRGYERNVASREDNVRAIVAKIELGEGDAAIVYATDALATDRVRVIPIPADANVAATYAAVALEGPDRGAAVAFLDWLTGPDGTAILAAAGFGTP